MLDVATMRQDVATEQRHSYAPSSHNCRVGLLRTYYEQTWGWLLAPAGLPSFVGDQWIVGLAKWTCPH